MFFGISELFLHPDAFFERVSREKVNLVPPLVIVGTGAFFFAIIHVLYWVWDRSGWSFAVFSYGSIIGEDVMSLIATSVILPFVIWGLFSVLIHVLSRMSGGTGSFPATVRVVGYGMLPWTVSAIIPFIVFLHKFFTYIDPWVGGHSGIWLMPPMYCELPLLGIMIWGCYLWTLGVVHTHHLPLKRAAAVTAIPVVAFLLLSLPVLWYTEMARGLLTGG